MLCRTCRASRGVTVSCVLQALQREKRANARIASFDPIKQLVAAKLLTAESLHAKELLDTLLRLYRVGKLTPSVKGAHMRFSAAAGLNVSYRRGSCDNWGACIQFSKCYSSTTATSRPLRHVSVQSRATTPVRQRGFGTSAMGS